MNQGEFVSIVENTLKGNSKDGRISRRYILSLGYSTAKFLISQKLSDMSLYKEDNIYTTVNCVELIDVDKISCPIFEFRTCQELKRSKKKLPELIYSRHGHSIKEVTALDEQYIFKPSTVSQYRRNKNRSQKSKDLYFYVKDGYLYIPDSQIKLVDIYILTQDLYELEQCSECSGKNCQSAWEYEFVCPDKLLDVVVQETLKKVGVSKSIPEDVNPNLNPNA